MYTSLSRRTGFTMAYTKKLDRDEVVVTALALVEQEGVEALTMRGVADRCHVQVSSLYHHFVDKAALMRAVTELAMLELGEALGRAREAAGQQAERQLRAVAIAYREWALVHPRVYRMLLWDKPVDEQPSAIAQSVSAPVVAAAAQLVGEEQAIAATQAIWAFAHGFVSLELAGQMRIGIPLDGFYLGLNALVHGLTERTGRVSG